MQSVVVVSWPIVDFEARTWVPDPRNRGPRADRLLGEYRSAVVPSIAERPITLSSSTLEAITLVEVLVAKLQAPGQADLAALAGALLRSESVSSSKIEHLSARQSDVALAAYGLEPARGGHRAAAITRAVLANINAITTALGSVEPTKPLTTDELLVVHRTLLAHDPAEGGYAGRVRDVQNWIGGSDHSPRNATFVPPAPERLAEGLADLMSFCARQDLSPVALAAIAHAQFETLHPFTDGNGRTGRALIHLLWRKLMFAPEIVVPVSTVLLSDVDAYFDGLTRYRQGDLDSWLARFATAAGRAALAGSELVDNLNSLRTTWLEAARPRARSTVATLIDLALSNPVIDIHAIRAHAPTTDPNLYRAIDRLCNAGILDEVTGHGRNRIWLAPDVFGLLEAFETQAGRRTKPTA